MKLVLKTNNPVQLSFAEALLKDAGIASYRLDEQARLLERRVSGPPIEKLIAEEQGRSQAYDGRTAFGMSATRSTPTRR